MWDDLREDIAVDLESLHKSMDGSVVDRTRLLALTGDDLPGLWDIHAAGLLLHGCYNGMENALKLIVKTLDNQLPAGGRWHSELLDMAAKPSLHRAAVISPDLDQRLRVLMGFRHIVRVHYGYELDWKRMRPLIEQLPTTIEIFESEIREFLDSLPHR